MASRLRAFVDELRRRRVFRVAGVYAVVALVVLQVADLVFPALVLPAWPFMLLLVFALLGFAIALALALAWRLSGVFHVKLAVKPGPLIHLDLGTADLALDIAIRPQLNTTLGCDASGNPADDDGIVR